MFLLSLFLSLFLDFIRSFSVFHSAIFAREQQSHPADLFIIKKK